MVCNAKEVSVTGDESGQVAGKVVAITGAGRANRPRRRGSVKIPIGTRDQHCRVRLIRGRGLENIERRERTILAELEDRAWLEPPLKVPKSLL